jgi:hypothetical protein
VLICISHFPQIHRINILRSTYGISFAHVFITLIFIISQLCMHLMGLTFQFSAINCIRDGSLTGFDVLGALLPLLQTVALCIGSLALYAHHSPPVELIQKGTNTTSFTLFLRFPSSPPNVNGTNTNSRIWTQSSRIISLTLLTLHTILFLIPIVFIAATDPSEVIIFGFLVMIYVLILWPLIPLLAVGRTIPQVAALWQHRSVLKSTSLSLPSIGLQAIAYPLLGLSWCISVRNLPPWVYNCQETWSRGWYCCSGWRWLPYVIAGAGELVSLGVYAFSIWRYRQVAEVGEAENVAGDDEKVKDITESTPLLHARDPAKLS